MIAMIAPNSHAGKEEKEEMNGDYGRIWCEEEEADADYIELVWPSQ